MSIDQTDIERFHEAGLVTLSSNFPSAWLNTANKAIDAIDDADFLPQRARGCFRMV